MGMVTEQDFIKETLIERMKEAEWQTQFTGKDHLVIKSGEFGVTLCGRVIISKDYWEVEDIEHPHKPNKCKQCSNAETIKDI